MEWAKEKVAAEEINKLLLGTDRDGNIIIHIEAEYGSLDISQELLEWAKEKLTALEIKWFYYPQTEKQIASSL